VSAKLSMLKACEHRRLERQTSHGWTMESVAIYKACKSSRRTSCLVTFDKRVQKAFEENAAAQRSTMKHRLARSKLDCRAEEAMPGSQALH
jgi:hypothetical protein